MYTHFKKLLPAACTACACLTTFVSANNGSYDHSNSHSDADSRHRSMMGLPDASPRVTNGADVFLGVDFILWTADSGGAIAATGGFERLKDAAGGMTDPAQGTVHYFDNDFDPGFKAVFGLNLQHDGDDTLLRYTWFYTNHTQSVSAGNNTFTGYPSQALGIPVDIVDGFPLAIAHDKVTAQYNMHFNNFDWEFGRGFYTSPYMTLRFHIGLKGGWADSFYKSTSAGTVLHDWDQNEGRDIGCYDPISLISKSDLWWVGIRGGFDPTFYFTKNWSMFGKFSLSTLWNGDKNTRREQVSVCNNSQEASGSKTQKTPINQRGTDHLTGQVLETELGFKFDYWWDDDNYHMALAASWENQVWTNVGPSSYFQGFHIGIVFGF